MGVVKYHQTGSQHTGWKRVARLPHNKEHHGNCQSTESSWHGTEGEVGHVVFDVRVADILEQKSSIKANEPAHAGKQQLSKRRVHIEEIGTLKVVRSELAKHYLC